MTLFLWNAYPCFPMMYEKLDMILENKMFQKLKLPKIFCNKDCFSKLILLYKQIRQIQMLFDKANWLLESNFCNYVNLQQHPLTNFLSVLFRFLSKNITNFG